MLAVYEYETRVQLSEKSTRYHSSTSRHLVPVKWNKD
uniref:Uncharacterized protein n=1 Tax=Arundo donax TaxID=35708 RepID=A0A0A9GPX4_ARUDO